MNLPIRTTFVAGLVLLGLACGGSTTPEPEAEPAPAPVAADPAPAPEPVREGKRRKSGKHKAGKAGTTDEVVAAYLADCHHVFAAAEGEEMDEGIDDECAYLPFDQNCGPDPFGCWDKGQGCESACGKPCETCQDACGTTCDGCKEQCGGKPACERSCAEARATCRTSCTDGRTACREACTDREHDCYETADEQKAEKCPDCEALGSCMYEKMVKNEPTEGCLKEHPGNAEECLEWCYTQ